MLFAFTILGIELFSFQLLRGDELETESVDTDATADIERASYGFSLPESTEDADEDPEDARG